MAYHVQVIVPFFKAPEKLKKCAEALDASTYKNWVKVVVDDSDTGNGFTETVNTGIRSSFRDTSTDFYLVLNQDAYVEPDTIEKMVGFMEANPCCAMQSVKQLSDKDPDLIVHGGVGPCFPNGIHKVGRVSKGELNKATQVPWAQGACFMVRASAIVEFGLMDESMKMIFSDSDWSYTARSRGWECWYNPEAVVTHEQGVSNNPPESLVKVFEADALAFRDKWVGSELFRDLSLEVFE